MPDGNSYLILRRATSPEDERLWREIATREAQYAAAALDSYVDCLRETGDDAAGQYLVVEVGGFSGMREFEVKARTEFDVEEQKRDAPEEVAA